MRYYDIVSKAVRHDGNTIRFIHPSFHTDPQHAQEYYNLCTTAVTSPCLSHGGGRGFGTCLRFCTEEMQNNKSIVLAAVEYNGISLAHASLALQNDRAVVEAALVQNGRALQYVGGGRGGILQIQMDGAPPLAPRVDAIEQEPSPATEALVEETMEDQRQRELNEQLQHEHAIAQYNLGTAYYAGMGGIVKSMKKARHWWELASSCGHAIAQYNLGLMYLNGLGVPSQSYTTSLSYFNLAYENGHEHAEHMCLLVEEKRLQAEGPQMKQMEQELKVSCGGGVCVCAMDRSSTCCWGCCCCCCCCCCVLTGRRWTPCHTSTLPHYPTTTRP